jgi:hypothetical protein
VSADRVSKATILVEHLLGVHQHCQHAKITPEVREAQRVYEQDVIEFWDERKAGDQAAIDRNQLYMSEVTQAECRAGIHRYCIHDEAHDDNEYMSSMGCAGAPVGQVWGTVNPGGTVTARGFTDNENYHDDTAVHPARSLVAYHPDDNTWVHTATGQTVQRQREIDAERARKREQATPTPASTPGATTAAAGGGGGMSSMTEAQGFKGQIAEAAQAAAEHIQGAIGKLEELQQALLGGFEESQQAGVDEAKGSIAEAISEATALLQRVLAVPETMEGVQT